MAVRIQRNGNVWRCRGKDRAAPDKCVLVGVVVRSGRGWRAFKALDGSAPMVAAGPTRQTRRGAALDIGANAR